MKKIIAFFIYSIIINWSKAQTLELRYSKAMVTNDSQQLILDCSDDNFWEREIFHDKTRMSCTLNGVDQEGTWATENEKQDGRVIYFGKSGLYTFYYRAPKKMPQKNPVEIKIIVTTKSSKVLSVTKQVYIVAEHWKFYEVNGMRLYCPQASDISSNATMGASAMMEQDFHFTASSFNKTTGEAKAILDGEPYVNKFRIWASKPCAPEYFEIAANWGDDVFTKIKEVKARFDGSKMIVDFKIDYMDYLAYKTRPLVKDAQWIQAIPKMKGSKNVEGKLVAPLQNDYAQQYKDKQSTATLKVTAGTALQAQY